MYCTNIQELWLITQSNFLDKIFNCCKVTWLLFGIFELILVYCGFM